MSFLRKFRDNILSYLPSDELNDFYYEHPKAKNAAALEAFDPERYAFVTHPFIIFCAILGMPTRRLGNVNPTYYLGNVFLNFIGWQQNVTLGRMIFNFFKMPLSIAWNTLHVLIKLPRNLLQFAGIITSELLFGTLDLLEGISSFIHTRATTSSALLNLLISLPAYAIDFVNLVAFVPVIIAVSFFASVLQSVIAPITAVKTAWRYGSEKSGENSGLGSLLGSLLALSSVAITVATYTLAAPIFAGAIIPYLPDGILDVLNFISNFAEPVLSKLAMLGDAILMPVFPTMANILAMIGLSAATGIGFVVGLVLPSVGTVIDAQITHFNHWWNHSSQISSEHISQYTPRHPLSTSAELQKNLGQSAHPTQSPRAAAAASAHPIEHKKHHSKKIHIPTLKLPESNAVPNSPRP